MPFYDFFRNFFGLGSTQEPPHYRFDEDPKYTDSFRNPIWQSDEDEDDVSDFGNRHPGRYQFRIFSDPFEMTRFFETQMDDMMKNFFSGFLGFGNDANVFGPFGDNSLPMLEDRSPPKGPRDEVLKPEFETPYVDEFQSSRKGLREELMKPAYEMPGPNNKKLDSDLDGKIKTDDLAKLWKNPSSSQELESFKPQFSIRSFGNSVSTQIIKRPDGSVEQRRTVRDSEGNEEVTVTRQIGDKVHTLISKKAKDGSETKTEDIVNMDESDLKGFEDKWTKIQVPKEDHLHNFPWFRFFGPNPKL